MSTVSMMDASANFAALVDDAASGEFITITRHGKPAAVLVSVEAADAARKAMTRPQANFGEYLMSFPGGIGFERNRSDKRDADL